MELTGRRECAIIEVSDRRQRQGERWRRNIHGFWKVMMLWMEQAEPLKKDRQARYRCRCDCGGEITVREPVFAMEVLQAVAACGGENEEEKCRSRRKEVRSDRETICISHSREEAGGTKEGKLSLALPL